MKRIASLLFILFMPLCWSAEDNFPSLDDLQGAWWSDENNPTADFAIIGEQVWLDAFEELQECELRDNHLIFVLNGGTTKVENEIVSLKDGVLVLKNKETKQIVTLKKVE